MKQSLPFLPPSKLSIGKRTANLDDGMEIDTSSDGSIPTSLEVLNPNPAILDRNQLNSAASSRVPERSRGDGKQQAQSNQRSMEEVVISEGEGKQQTQSNQSSMEEVAISEGNLSLSLSSSSSEHGGAALEPDAQDRAPSVEPGKSAPGVHDGESGASQGSSSTPSHAKRPLTYSELRRRRRLIRHTKNPEDNYEISDRESTDEEDDSPDRSHKRVPSWCDNWLEQVGEQVKYDPDVIFGTKLLNPELARVFGLENVPPKRRKRGSSQNWENDKLTIMEIRDYKRTMGQTEIIEVDEFEEA